ncbi:MAG: C10 family peptidase [Bacteroidaceae bacterium]|nr:C10 family peptidase [Bacteroidaceae bacterium]
MKQLLTVACLLSMGVCAVNAAPITRSQARAIASKYIQKMGTETRAGTLVAQNGENEPYYVFGCGNNSGFVIVSGDDEMPQLVGYTEKGDFSMKNIPANMKKYLSDYSQIVRKVQKDAKLGITHQLRGSASYTPVAPLVTTKWGQGEPYNNTLPKWVPDYDPDGEGMSNITGCVATSMAQIMHHYQYPSETQASINGFQARTFSTEGGDSGTVVVPAVAAGTSIAWNNILTQYVKGQYTDAQANAVAELMRYCGTSVEMDYAPDLSLSDARAAAAALRNYFGYDDICRWAISSSYSGKEWEALLHSELEAGRPILYAGQSTTGGGHAFVCDGANSEGLFHINWGWDGMFDGYYDLVILNPYVDQPLYAGEDGFANSQMAVIGIRPDNGIAEASSLPPVIINYGFPVPTPFSVQGTGGEFACSIQIGVCNMGSMSYNCKLAIAYLNDNNEITRVCPSTNLITIPSGAGGTLEFNMNGTEDPKLTLPVGKTTRLFMVYAGEDGVWHPASDAANKFLTATVSADGSQLNFTYYNLNFAAELVPAENYYVGRRNQMVFRVTNNSPVDYDGEFYLYMSRTKDPSSASFKSSCAAYLLAGSTSEIVLYTAKESTTEPYYYWLCYPLNNNAQSIPNSNGSITLEPLPKLQLISAKAKSAGDRRIVANIDGYMAQIPWIKENDTHSIDIEFVIKNNTDEKISGAFYINELWKMNGERYELEFWEPIGDAMGNYPTQYYELPAESNIKVPYSIDLTAGFVPAGIYAHFINKFVCLNGDTIYIEPCITTYPTTDGADVVDCENGAVWFSYMDEHTAEEYVAGINAVKIDDDAISVAAIDGGVRIFASKAAKVKVASVSGVGVTSLTLDAGEVRTLMLPSGIYLIGNTKVVVR